MKLLEGKKTFTTIASHLLIWSMLLAFPFLFSNNDTTRQPDSFFYLRTTVPFVFLALIFYLNYFWLIDQFLFRDRLVVFIAINFALALCCFFVNELLMETIREQQRMDPEFREAMKARRRPNVPERSGWKLRTFLSFLLTAGTSVAIRSTQKWLQTESDKKNLENEHLKSELEHLRYQVQPHFFFNSLNNIYSLVDGSPTKAKETIHGLSKLMRHVLYETKDEKILISQEIAFLKNFIKLMEIRLTSSVSVKTEFPTTYPKLEIAPLLLVPLAENAFKHGVSAKEPTSIFIGMEIKNEVLYFTTQNTFIPKTNDEYGISGIGIENLKKRLELIYPNRYEFQQEVINGMYYSNLILNL